MVRTRDLIGTLLILWISSAQAVITGANSLVSVEPLTVYPSSDTNNQILQFAFMQSGFTLQNSTVTCTFGTVFPVSGIVGLSGGTLYLSTDFALQNPAILVSTGYFWANGHQLDFSSSVTWLPTSNQSTFRNASVYLNSDLLITGSTSFIGSCILDGGGHTITLGSGANIVSRHNSNLTLRNMTLKGVSGSKLLCLDNSASLVLDNTALNMSGNYTFTRGSILFKDSIDIAGPYVFTFGNSLTSTIASNSTLMFDVNTTLSYDPSVSNQPLIYMNDATAFLFLNSCSLFSTRTGLSLSQGNLVIDNLVTFSSQGRRPTEGITLKSPLNTILFSGALLQTAGILNIS